MGGRRWGLSQKVTRKRHFSLDVSMDAGRPLLRVLGLLKEPARFQWNMRLKGYLAHKKPPPLGPYSRPMHRALWWGVGVYYERGTPVGTVQLHTLAGSANSPPKPNWLDVARSRPAESSQ